AAVVFPFELVGRYELDRGWIAAGPGPVHLRGGSLAVRSDASDEIGAVFVLRSIPMNLAGIVDHVGALRHAGGVVPVDDRTRPPPRRAVDHQDVTVDEMMMRFSAAPRLEFIDHHKEALSRVTVKDGVVVRTL